MIWNTSQTQLNRNTLKIFIKGLNSCAMRKQKLLEYKNFFLANHHDVIDNPADSDIIIVWTCAFRADVRDNSISQLKMYQKQYNAEVIAAGCLPDIDLSTLKHHFNGKIISWRDDQRELEQIIPSTNTPLNQCRSVFVEENLCDNIEQYKIQNPQKDITFHDQFIKLVISEGCSFTCSYCSERLAFPPFNSVPEQKLINTCKDMVKKTGCKDIVLLADSLGEYGKDINSSLPQLIKNLKTIDKDLRFALNNLNLRHFIDYYDEMTQFFQKGYIRHINLPIQSASQTMLTKMNRAYTKEEMEIVFSFLNQIQFKEFDSHIILGFPGETEDDLMQTIQFIIAYHPKYVLINKYMETPNAPSAELSPKIDDHTAMQRIFKAENEFKKRGIICNTEQGELLKDRLKRMNN